MTKQLHKLLLLFLATFLVASGYAHDVEKNVNIHNLNADFKTSSVPSKMSFITLLMITTSDVHLFTMTRLPLQPLLLTNLLKKS